MKILVSSYNVYRQDYDSQLHCIMEFLVFNFRQDFDSQLHMNLLYIVSFIECLIEISLYFAKNVTLCK